MPPKNVALIGSGKRIRNMYVPLLRQLEPEFRVIGICSDEPRSGAALAEHLNCPFYPTVSDVATFGEPDFAIIAVDYKSNGKVALEAIRCNLNLLLETPIAHDPQSAQAVVNALKLTNLRVEVAEQFPWRPCERAAINMCDLGLCGTIHTVYSDWVGHGYHGLALLRSIVGLDKPIRSLLTLGGSCKQSIERRFIEFEDGSAGFFNWTHDTYNNSQCFHRCLRVYGDRGKIELKFYAGNVECEMVSSNPKTEGWSTVSLVREYERHDGGGLVRILANSANGEAPVVVWKNPLPRNGLGALPQLHDDEIGVATCIMNLTRSLSQGNLGYGTNNAMIDLKVGQFGIL